MPRTKITYQPKDAFSEGAYPHQRDNTIWFTEDPSDFVIAGRRIEGTDKVIKLVIQLLPPEIVEEEALAAAWIMNVCGRSEEFQKYMSCLASQKIPRFTGWRQAREDDDKPLSASSLATLEAYDLKISRVDAEPNLHTDFPTFIEGARFVITSSGRTTQYYVGERGNKSFKELTKEAKLLLNFDEFPLGAVGCIYLPASGSVADNLLLLHTAAFDYGDGDKYSDRAVIQAERAFPVFHRGLPSISLP